MAATTKTPAAAAPAASPDQLVSTIAEIGVAGAALIKSKPWHKSLTVQGALVAGAGAGVVAYGPAVLTACHMDPAAASQLAQGVAGVLGSVGALMSLVGRLRLGGLS